MVNIKIKPGCVVPHPEHIGEWTFYFFLNGVRVYDTEENYSRSFTKAYAAKQAMRERCGIS